MSRRFLLGCCLLFTPVIRAQSPFWAVDTGFAPVLEAVGSPTSLATSVVASPNGKALVNSGYAINGVLRSGLVRLAADGSLDTDFSSPAGESLAVIAVYPDSRVLVQRSVSIADAGRAVSIRRLRADGSFDPSFTEIAISPTPVANATAQLRSDGRILLSGGFAQVAGRARNGVALLEADGSLNLEFTSPLSEGSSPQTTALAGPSGGFYVYGWIFDTGPDKRKWLMRLNADGSIDPSFNPPVNADASPPTRVRVQADGKVLLGRGSGPDAGLIRLNVDGSVDPAFPRLPEIAEFSLRESDGGLFHTRTTGSSQEMHRVNADGTGDAVIATLPYSPLFAAVQPQFTENNALLIDAPITAERQAAHFVLSRVLASGQIDASYNPRFTRQATPAGFLPLAGGRLLLSGQFDRVNGADVPDGFGIVRFNADGTTDTTFSWPNLAVAGGSFLMREQPGGKILLEGSFPEGTGTRRFVRLNPNGTPDPTFVEPALLQSFLAMDPVGRFYGTPGDGTPGDGTLRRYLPDGGIDPSFVATASVGSGHFIAPFADGTVALTTRLSPTSSNYTVVRLRADGSSDPSFVANRSSFPSLAAGPVALPDGQVLLYGTSSTMFGVGVRYLRLARNGAVTYTYFGPDLNTTQITAFESFTLAGVLHDLLDEAAVAGARVRTNYLAPSRRAGADLDVGADNTLYLSRANDGSQATFARYARSTSSAVTIDARPTLLFQFATPPLTLSMGGSTTFSTSAGGLFPLTYQWFKDGVALPGAASATYSLASARGEDAGTYTFVVSNAHGSVSGPPMIVNVNTNPAAVSVSQPILTQTVASGGTASFRVSASGNPLAAYAWQFNGQTVTLGGDVSLSTGTTGSSTTSSTLNIARVAPQRAGLYSTIVSNSVGQVVSQPFILGLSSNAQILGAGAGVGDDILHANGNIFDQVLLTGGAATITAQAGQIVRASFADLNRDIVQVEFSGAGALTIVLDAVTTPAEATNYQQPGVNYVTGHAGIVVTGANETTHLSAFSVGRITAINPTLFREDVAYDGVADLAFIAIQSPTNNFGSLRTGNASFFATRGFTGVYAPGVQFTGPVIVGDIDAHDAATPVLVLAGAEAILVPGGDLAQTNSRPIWVSGSSRLILTAGVNSHGQPLAARANRARFESNGVDATDRVDVIVSP